MSKHRHNDFTIRRAAPGNGGHVAELIRRSLPPDLRPLTIWESPRADLYVESLLSRATAVDSHEFYLLRRDNANSGVAALRHLDGGVFLNHLYIEPELRGCGLGAWLFRSALGDYLSRHRAGRLALDVFAGAVAESWYHRLGFREHGRSRWWLSEPTPVDRAPENGHVAGWGFYTFSLRASAGRRYDVGSLYAPYFRLTDPRAAVDVELHRDLARIDASRRLLLISPGDAAPAGWTQVAATRGLACDAAQILAALAARPREAHAA